MSQIPGSSRDHEPSGNGAARGEVLPADPIIRALYSPSRGEVGCVLIQAALQGDRRACNIFDARDWFTSPVADMTWITAPASQWEAVAAMPKAERLRLPILAEPEAARNPATPDAAVLAANGGLTPREARDEQP